VVFLFLRSARATLIPAVAVPVSLIGTFAIMYVAGFSLNNLSLMALTIATGFVVDDAIVVLENVTRHLESGMPRFQAAILGAREVGFTVMSMSLSLIAVFIPILLMGGILGRLFREFAITLSVAILVSLVISLTTTPMMCARVLRQPSAKEKERPDLLGRFLERLVSGYGRSLRWALKHSFIMLLLLLATVACNVYLFTRIPKGFFPQQDVGLIVGGVQADQSISFTALKTKLEALTAIVQQDKAVDTVSGFTGGGASAFVFVALKPLSQRDASADQIINRLRPRTSRITGAQLFLNAAQDIRVGGRGSNAQFQYTIQADSLEELRAWTPRITQALLSVPEITDVNLDTQDKGLQTSLVYDRDTLSRLGLTVSKVDGALYDAFGQEQVSTLFKSLNQYHVVMEVAPDYWQSPAALNGVYVSSYRGAQVPLPAFSRYEPTTTALSVNHQGQFVATTLSFNLALGVSLSQASAAIEAVMNKLALPSTVIGSFQGTARVFQESLNNELILILAAFVAVYIVLGILYESYIHPITILSTLPSAGVGAFLALILFNTDFTIIALIGMLLLIGIVKKNAIMMIDFAIAAERAEDLSPRDAIFKACLLRFRPIMMTTMAALLGALPLAIGLGEGSELRKPLGIAIVGGLIFSQVLTLYTTPVVYLYFDRFRVWLEQRRRARRQQRLLNAAAAGSIGGLQRPDFPT
jgi:multidrug efflux pump